MKIYTDYCRGGRRRAEEGGGGRCLLLLLLQRLLQESPDLPEVNKLMNNRLISVNKEL